MLNDWSDRSKSRKRGLLATGEFWLGATTTLIGLALLIGFLSWFFR